VAVDNPVQIEEAGLGDAQFAEYLDAGTFLRVIGKKPAGA
jgi:hypothetical protein